MKTVHFSLILLGLTAILSCKKNDPAPEYTYIELDVVDNVSNGLLSKVEYEIYYETSIKGNSFTIHGATGDDGKIISTSANDTFPDFMYIYKNGYIPKLNFALKMKPGDSILQEIRMHRYDGVLKINVENHKNKQDSLWLAVRNGVVIADMGASYNQFGATKPLILSPLEKRTFYVDVVSNDPVSIYWEWGGHYLPYQIPFKNVVIPAIGDTLVYKVVN